MKKRGKVVLLLPLVVFAFFEGRACLAEDSILGGWSGTVSQSGSGSYEVAMTMDSAGGGSIEYPSLACGGSLSGGGSGGVYQYRESITYGGVTPEGGGCINGGSIRMVLQGDAIFWEWKGSYEAEDYYVSGKLYRSATAQAKNCAECGEALLNDIGYGLPESQNFRNYAHEAQQNYANCIRDIADGCQNSCGRQLYDNLPACERFDDPGHKACAETALAGARLSCP